MRKSGICIDCEEHVNIFGIQRCRNCYSRYKENLAPKKECECGCGELIPSTDESGNPRKYKYRHGTNGENNGRWKGGTYINSDGYRYILKPDHPRANNRGYVFEHILNMEKKLGRYLKEGEIVDHDNGDKLDNREENLNLTNRKDHQNKHNPRKGYEKDVSGRICLECGSDKTYKDSRTGHPHWCRHPITGEEWYCEKCYKRLKRSMNN